MKDNKFIVIVTFVVTIISLIVMVKTCKKTEESVILAEKSVKIMEKENKLRIAEAKFDNAGDNTDMCLESYTIYREIFEMDNNDKTGYYKFLDKANGRLNELLNDETTEWYLLRAKELTKDSKEIETIDSLLKKCQNEKY